MGSTGKIAEKVVIVTGAAHGMGRAMTLGLLATGARVGAVDVPGQRAALDDVIAEGARYGVDRSMPLPCDVTDAERCAAIVAELTAKFGTVHAIINNAALQTASLNPRLFTEPIPFSNVTPAQWRRMVDVNVNGPFYLAHAAVPRMLAQGWGRIVNVVTSARTMQAEGHSPYGPTKAMLEAATVIWSKDLAGTGVTVNSLMPGWAADTSAIPAEEIPDRTTLVAPEAMVAPAVWLCSEDSDAYSGSLVIANRWQQGIAAAVTPAGWPSGFAAPYTVERG